VAEKERIYWNDDEKHKLIDAVFVMRQNDPDSSLISIINRAQAQLPKDRQRTIPSVKVIPWLSEALKTKFRDMREKARALESAKTEATTAKKTQSDLKQRLTDMVSDARRDAIKKTSTEDLLIEIMARVETQHQEILQRLARLEGRAVPVKVEIPKPKPEKKLPRVLVVGMLASQSHEISARFKGRAELLFLPSDGHERGIPQADVAIINSRFTPHDTQNKVLDAFNNRGAAGHTVHGGVSAVITKIGEIL